MQPSPLRSAAQVLIHPALWALITITGFLWAASVNLTPRLDAVRVVSAGETATTLLGDRFGTTGQVLADGAPVTITAWSPTNVQVAFASATPTTVQLVRTLGPLRFASQPRPVVFQAADLPSAPNGYANAVHPQSPWPTFRRDHRNTGYSPLPAAYMGDQPWFFQTGKGIFSTPIIGPDGTIYVGSADHSFYALNPDGSLAWQYETGEIIDSAAALPLPNLFAGAESILVPSADGFLYHLATDPALSAADRLLWRFEVPAAFNNWWEGNVQIGFDGTVYAGNTNFNYYALTPSGDLKWVYPTASNAWSIAALADDGTIYWGSNDTYIRAVSPTGDELWATSTLGFIAASAAIGSDGTVYIGSFDSYLYALDPTTGAVRWRFKTDDHIYSSAALLPDAAGNTSAIFVGSADGRLYGLTPSGELLWVYDTGDPIRSSPVVAPAPASEAGHIVYVGNGGGQLYAINAADGSRRWSYNTTPLDPELADRNDLNASPSLGETGVYIAGEHGQIWYLPYDYCLHNSDPRCTTDPGSDLPADIIGLFYVTPGGSTLLDDTTIPDLPAATLITLRLVVREDDLTLDARVCSAPIGCPSDSLVVTATPPFDFELEKSADGQYLFIRPTGYLTPGQTYTLSVTGDYYTGGLPVGNLQLGGDRAGEFSDTLDFTVAPSTAQIPFRITDDRLYGVELTRLAVPIPPMMPSLNQIGFDYIDWVLLPIEVTPPDETGIGQLTIWANGAVRDSSGNLTLEPDSEFQFLLTGTYQGDSVILTNEKFVMPVTGIPIPFNRFELRGQFDADGVIRPGAVMYADTAALDIPTFGPYLVIAGLANNVYEKLLVTGTYITRPFDTAPVPLPPAP